MKRIRNFYQGKELAGLKDMYDSLLPISDYKGLVIQFLYDYVDLLWAAYQNQNLLACIEVSNYHKDFLGWKLDKIFEQKLIKQDIVYTVALEFGYHDIPDMENRANVEFKSAFEKAVDALVAGEIEKLESLISSNFPFNETSSFGHNAALIHYLGSNGFEIIRQQVPLKIIAIIDLLKKYEIDWNQKMDVYGGKHNVLQLADTSIHPYKAGLNKKLHIALQSLIP